MRRAEKGTRPGKGEISGQPQPQRDPAGSSGAELTPEARSHLEDKELGFGTPHSPSPASLGWGGGQFPNAIP